MVCGFIVVGSMWISALVVAINGFTDLLQLEGLGFWKGILIVVIKELVAIIAVITTLLFIPMLTGQI